MHQPFWSFTSTIQMFRSSMRADKNLALISVRRKERYTKSVICMRVKLCAGVLIESNVETQVYTNYISPFVTFCDVMGWISQAPGNRRSQRSTMKTDAHTKINLRTIIEKNQSLIFLVLDLKYSFKYFLFSVKLLIFFNDTRDKKIKAGVFHV